MRCLSLKRYEPLSKVTNFCAEVLKLRTNLLNLTYSSTWIFVCVLWKWRELGDHGEKHTLLKAEYPLWLANNLRPAEYWKQRTPPVDTAASQVDSFSPVTKANENM